MKTNYTTLVTCPHCGYQREELMSEDALLLFYECRNCRQILSPENNDCCVYCSYGSVKCPKAQERQKTR